MMKIDYVSGSNIVSLLPRRRQMIFPAIKAVEAYWEGLRAGRVVPARSEIDPRGMQPALEHAFILERIAPGVARFRLAGSHLTDLMGMEVRGMPLTAMFVPESRARVSAVLEAVFDTPSVTALTLRGEQGLGRGALSAELLLCPLKSDLGDVNRVLGCLQSNGAIGRQPRRFEVLEVNSRALLTDGPRVLTPQGAHPTERAPVPGFSETQPVFRHGGGRTPASRPMLRLVKTDGDAD